MTDRASRRTYAAAVLTGVVSGALIFFAASRTWASVEVAPPGMTVDLAEVTGSSAVPLVGAMAFVVMAGAVAVVASAGWLRRGIGVLVLLAGATAAVSAATAGDAVDDALREEVASSASMTAGPEQQDALVEEADATLWRWGASGFGLVAVAVGGTVVAQGGRWPRMGQKYDAPGAAPRQAAAAPPEERDVADLWKALDDGDDPTA